MLVHSFQPDTLRDGRTLLPVLVDGIVDKMHNGVGDQHRGKLILALFHEHVGVRFGLEQYLFQLPPRISHAQMLTRWA